MDARELRIGNYVLLNNNVKIVTPTIILEQNQANKAKQIYLESIKPTEILLIEFGFKEVNPKRGIISSFIKNGIRINISNSGNYYYKNILILSIHQIQNLYFALTREELTLKNN